MGTKTILAIGLIAGAAAGWTALGHGPGAWCRSNASQPAAIARAGAGNAAHDGAHETTRVRVVVPDVGALPELDGELDDAIWQAPVARTGAFLDAHGAPARPYSDARVAWTKGYLVVALYAADEDIRTSGEAADAFRVVLGEHAFDVTASGELRGAPAGARAGHDADGTLDDPSNDDEEWVIELVVPLASLGLEGREGEHLAFSAARCDTTHDGVRRCGAARGVDLVLGGARAQGVFGVR